MQWRSWHTSSGGASNLNKGREKFCAHSPLCMRESRRARLRQVGPRDPRPPYIGPLAAVACAGFWNRRGQESPSPFLDLSGYQSDTPSSKPAAGGIQGPALCPLAGCRGNAPAGGPGGGAPGKILNFCHSGVSKSLF